MRRIELNYQKPANPPSRTAGWTLLLVGVALLIEMGVSYDRLQSEREDMDREIRISKIRMDMPSELHNTGKYTDKDFEEGRQILNRLSTPWDTLFVGLESVSNENVAILSIEPNMHTGLLQIEGEAKNYASVLSLVAQLRTIKPFSQVFLLNHETKRDDPQHPVSFALSVHWEKPS